MIRLRQIVLVAPTREPLAGELRRELGLAEPFHDPGVAAFGLENAVMACGDTFVEVVAPVQPGTTAGRYLERRGAGGYMVILQLDDLDAARPRLDDLGVRVVWRFDGEDIAGTHLHPKDVPGAILSLDRATPPASWRWAGPAWTGGAPEHDASRAVGVTIQSDRPDAVAERWGAVLDRPVARLEGSWQIDLDGGWLRFVPTVDARGEGIVGFTLEVPDRVRRARSHVELGGARFDFAPAR